ncbi:protein ELYS-like [Rhopalosiphum maidis]|uniref:protein ELYS-like n=1 Tax=Rhopalosiphum maidis TaxID=43146 RepID=UPI000F000751|nr:protein ELYS-like [Rhopalosiphum maidis]
MEVLKTHRILFPSGLDRKDVKGGWIDGTRYVWFTYGANIDLYSTETRSVESSRSFNDVQTDKSLKITFVKEVQSEKIIDLLLVGCSFKSSGILFVCQLPKLTTICCIALPNPVSYISTILNKSLPNDQLCNELKIMSTILLVGMATGEVYAIDLKEHYIKNQLKTNKIVINELKPGQLFIIKNNDDFQKAYQITNGADCHLAMFLNETFYMDYKKHYCDKLDFTVSSLLYNEKINAVVIGYSTGYLQVWDCKVTQSYILKHLKYDIPITHITFLEPSYDPNNLCYLWVIQSDNSRLPNATMIALTYEQRIMMSNGCLSYKVYKENCIKLEMSLWKEAGIGRCISALTLCNDTLVRNVTGNSISCKIKLFAMLMEIRKNVNASSESYIFLFDINQWYKAQMPSNIDHLKVLNSFASFVKLPHNTSYLDLNISDKTLRPFSYNFINNVEELYNPSSIYFECDCLLDNEIVKIKHAGVQQEILDELHLNKWKLLENPSLIFSQCLQTNLKPFFWDKTDDYVNYSLLDKVHFLIAVIVENEIMSVLNAYAEECKNGTNVSYESISLLMQCLWNHFTLVNKYTDQLCVSLFDYSGELFCNNNENMLHKCLSQMLHVVHFYESMHSADSIQILNVDLMNREKKMKCVIQYFQSLIYFINYKLLPKQMEGDSMCQILQFNFSFLIQYSNNRRMEFGDLPLYLIDAVVTNDLKRYKFIEQWQQEFNNECKGLYPPSNIQDLLMINLNTELSQVVKNFIITYFLIDAYYLQKMNEIMTNVLNDISKKNDRLYKLCGATWFLDHDMFENAMLIFINYNKWLIDDDSWNWYHWNVLKLLVFKEQYYWAKNYIDLFEIKLVNLDDHKFYVNLHIMSKNCFEALDYMHSRGDMNEKNILFEYIFDQCRNTNQLQKIFNYPFDEDEKILFFSCLQKFDDTTSIQFKFLIEEKRYSEALEVSKLIGETKNFNITSVLVDGFTDIIPSTNRTEFNKKIYLDEEINNLFMKDDLFNIKNTNDIGHNKSFQINLNNPDVKYNDEAIDKLRRPKIILDENIDKSNLVELDIALKSEGNLEKPDDDIFDKESVDNKSEKPSEDYLENEDINIITEILVESIKKDKNRNNECDLKEVDILCEEIVDNTFDSFAVENRSNNNNQVYEEENENTFGNIINGNKTSFMVKEYHVTKLLKNKDKNSSASNYLLGIENHKDDLCNGPNEFNPIPEYNLNYHNMIGDNEIHPISISISESLWENFNLEAQAKKNGTQDSAVDNHEEIVIDEISEKNESSCVYKNVKDEKKSLNSVKIKTSELIQKLKNLMTLHLMKNLMQKF